ncbi:Ubiquitin-conjugating enzyme E2 6 [Coemansia interrupta]|uniref:Ubiquitin-conjugating enzyme E2 6 n=1 Tax=Coemansia interrupta TaxID=1126814 RepID=A0A9W8LFW0_9FUNG|nr:Ubiquitin-conjugating enzyme E2 6 [Coemansia interrupta]
MASRAAFKRLNKEYLAIQANPPPFITAKPLESNILEWHYVLRGPPDTPYEGGEYHGRLRFPSEYPYKPPAIQMITPSGRFQTNTNICMSMSNYHPNTWNPAWSVATILNGMLSFMVEEEVTTGSIRISNADRKALARKSFAFNRANKLFCDIFPELRTANSATAATDASAVLKTAAQDVNASDSAPSTPKLVQRQPRNGQTQHVPATGLNKKANGAGAAHNNGTGAGAAAAAQLTGMSRKWIVLLVFLAYLFASKVLSRILSA